MDIRPAPYFLNVGNHRLFVTRWQADGADAAPILLLPPFAEEMNRVRRYVAELSKNYLTQGTRSGRLIYLVQATVAVSFPPPG